MKKLMKYVLPFWAVLVILNGCGPDEKPKPGPGTKNPVTGVVVTYENGSAITNDTISLVADGTATLKVALQPDGVSGTVTWSQGNEYVEVTPASGNMSAAIKGLQEGSLEITVSASNSDNTAAATKTITVTVVGASESPVTGLVVSEGAVNYDDDHEFEILPGETITLTVRPEPIGVEDVTVEWDTDDDDSLEITPAADGLSAGIKGLEAGGPYTFTVSAENDNNTAPVVRTFKVSVTDPSLAPVTGLIVSRGNVDYDDDYEFEIVEGASITLAVTPEPDGVQDVTDVTVEWDTTDTSGLDITAESDGLSAEIEGLEAGGPYTFTVSAENDNNTEPVVRTFTVKVIAKAEAPANWTTVSYTDFYTNAGDDAGPINKVDYGQDKFVAVGGNGITVHSGTDMVWTRAASPVADLRGVTYAGGKFFAVNYGNPGVISSADGITWAPESAAPLTSGLGIGSDGDQRIGAGGLISSGLAYSNNGGDSWPAANLTGWSTTGGVRGVAYGHGLAVIVGDAGQIAYAPVDSMRNDFTLITQVPGHTSAYIDVTFGGGKFVAVGNGMVAVSDDGINWAASNLTGSHQGVTYAGGYYVVGSATGISYSEDAITWTAAATQPGFAVNGVVYGGGKWIAVGAGGGIAYSGNDDLVKKPVRNISIRDEAEDNRLVVKGELITLLSGTEYTRTMSVEISPPDAAASATILFDAPTGVTVTDTATGFTVQGDTPNAGEDPYTVTVTVTSSDNTDSGTDPVVFAFDVTVVDADIPFPVETIIVDHKTATYTNRINDGDSLTLNVNQVKTLELTLRGPYSVDVSEEDSTIEWTPQTDTDVGIDITNDGKTIELTGISVTAAPVTFTVTASNDDNDPGSEITVSFTVLVAKPPTAWTEQSAEAMALFGNSDGADTASVDGVAYNGSVWVAGGRQNPVPDGQTMGVIFYSTDGKNWNDDITWTNTPPAQIRAGISGNGRFVFGTAAAEMCWSDDGKEWTNVSLGSLGATWGLSYSGGKFIATGSNSDRVAWSDDGETWKGQDRNPTGSGAVMWASAYGKVNGVDTWVIVGAGGTIKVTHDLDAATPVFASATTVPTSEVLACVAYGNGKFVAASRMPGDGVIITSTNGYDWVKVGSTGTNNNCMKFANGYFVIGSDSNRSCYSDDGVTWTDITGATNAPTNPHFRSLYYGDGMWIGGGRGNHFAFSELEP